MSTEDASEERGDGVGPSSEVTTSACEQVSSLASSSSASDTSTVLRKKLELLKTQLRHRDVELESALHGSDAHRILHQQQKLDIAHLQMKCRALTAICDELTSWLSVVEGEERQRMTSIEVLYKRHVDELSAVVRHLREENSKLRDRLCTNNAKAAAIITENTELRRQRTSMLEELEHCKTKLHELDLEKHRLSEKLSLAIDERKKSREDRKRMVEHQLCAAAFSHTTELEAARGLIHDREREYGLTLSRMKNEIEFLKTELKRKDTHAKALLAIADKLTEDNRDILEENSTLRNRLNNSGTGAAGTNQHIPSGNIEIAALQRVLMAERRHGNALAQNLADLSQDLRTLLAALSAK